MNRFPLFVLIFILVQSSACVTTPPMKWGKTTEKVSKFDNTKEIYMEHASIYSDSGITFSLFKNSKMPKDSVVLEARVMGLHTFADGESLLFNIDGDIIGLESIDAVPDWEVNYGEYIGNIYVPGYDFSSKRYVITKGLIKKLIDGRSVWVKIRLSKTYVEGEFSRNEAKDADMKNQGLFISKKTIEEMIDTMAHPSFKRFYERILQWQ